ncbi:multidrug-Resistance like Protein 1 isoform X2 [Oratosquilla oratoria]|uniref:multidrug-Resistance like Protein 1 isoform X2 n=1 Tax=Oratosquilla oratoria TaxID=337810 RepID=UPI003F762B93
MAGGGLYSYCGSPFWNDSLTWDTDDPEFTSCFDKTVLVWIPCGLLWLLAPLETRKNIRSQDRMIPWSWVSVLKTLFSSGLMVLQLCDLFYAVSRTVNEEVPTVFFLTPIILFLSFLLQLIFVQVERRRGIQSSGYIFLFWFLMAVCGISPYRAEFLKMDIEERDVDMFYFVTTMIFYPLVLLMLLLNFFADARPQYLEHNRGEKTSPELDASFPNLMTFAFFDRMVWWGYKKPLKQEILWDLTLDNTSEEVVKSWENNWAKATSKAYKKGESHTWATYANSAAQVQVSGTAGNKEHYVSILPTMIRTFGAEFFFGAILKLIYDIMQFVSPQILSALINYATDEEEPVWRGYFYAVIMFICAQFQSLVLGQYFMKMFVVGLRIRTAIISSVYKKALKISNSARKESTVGEIVNLMSVDAQRFMDLTTYLNMLWSSPLQICLALYFLYGILGASVFAGLAVMIVLIPVNGFIANKVKKLQIKQMKNKDKRVKLMNEILNGMKVLKLYAWEPSFEDQVIGVRNKEVSVLKQSAYLNAGTSFIWTCTPFLVSLASFAVFVSVSPDNILDARTAFVSISLFNLLRFPISMLPMLISNIVQASVSLKRMNKFMNAEELDPNAVSSDAVENDPVVIENGTFAWGHDKHDRTILNGINVRVKDGSLVAVVGTVGSGKSSLCSAILGEMEKSSGRVNVKGSVAYVPQQAWIQNCTLQDNILFGKSLDKEKYSSVVQACALQADLEMLPGGDKTEIGEKGINLSGGQKQRVSLARAVYNDADIYLLDDPLSAVDSHVGKHIFEHVIGPTGVLKGRTRILVTHGLTYLHNVDHIIVLKNGSISEQGTYNELMEKKGEFQEFLIQYLSENQEDEELEVLGELKHDLEKIIGREKLEQKIVRTRLESESEHDNNQRDLVKSTNNENIIEQSIGKDKEGSQEDDSTKQTVRSRKPKKISESEDTKPTKPAAAMKTGEKLIEAEKSETGRVKFDVYFYYMRAIGIVASLLTIFFYVASQACTVGSNIWLSEWSEANNTDDPSKRDMFLGVYGALGIGQALCTLLASFIVTRGTVIASKILHKGLLANVLKSPMSFFDTTPTGRLVNRFAKDIDIVDLLLPMNLRSWILCFISVLATFVVIIYSTPLFIVVMIPTMVLYYIVQLLYVSTSRQLKRIESISRSPIYSHFGESIQGASTIRAYKKMTDFIHESQRKVDFNQISYYPSTVANRWLAIRLETIGNVLTFFAALFAVIGRGELSPGIVGLSVSYALSVTQTLNWLVRMTSDVETNVVAVERVKEYTETPQEATWVVPNNRPPTEWPDRGVVKFNNYATRYREGLDLVIKDIEFEIKAGEKIGIVGRTGAGKSSLTLALFRIIESAKGNITIDGIDISKIGLHDLRNKLTIIPQDPVLFSGTLRMNLDPFSVYSDEAVWSALEHAHLKSFVQDLPLKLQHEITEGGDNLSVGQRQLVCLARALLRKTQVLILDEATAAVDLETDDLIQQTIKVEFASCTVLTIAHRLNTIMDSTRILLLDKGRIKEFEPPGDLLKRKDSMFYGMAKDAGLI